MARLKIISRSLALGMRLTDTHEVEEESADELGPEQVPSVEGFDVLVLDVGDPVMAVNTVNSLREQEETIPVMLISGYQPEWEQVEAQEVEGVHVVPLPITRQALLRGVAVLLDEDPELIVVDPTGAVPQVGRRPSERPVGRGQAQDLGAAESADDSAEPDAADDPDAPENLAPTVEDSGTADRDDAPDAQNPGGGRGYSGPDGNDDTTIAAIGPGAGRPAPTAKKPAPTAKKPAPTAKKAAKPAKSPSTATKDRTKPSGGPNPSTENSPADDTATAETGGPADVAAAKAVRRAAMAKGTGRPDQNDGTQDGQKSPQMQSSPQRQPPATGRLGQQIAARRALGQGGELAPAGDRYRRPGTRQPSEEIEVTPSQVAGLSYSSPVARPFAEHPPPGAFPLDRVPKREPGTSTVSARPSQSRWRSNPPPPTGSISMDSSNIAANRRMQRLGDRPRKLQRRGTTPAENTPRTPGRGLVTDPLGPRTNPYGFPVSALERRLDAEAGALVVPRGDGETAIRPADLVRLLQEQSQELYGVSDTSQVLADDVVERASADAAAVLVPDGPIWRVSGGVGLRPLERRLELAETHWLITEIGRAGRAVLIDDTDIVRQQLAGAPLAAWRRLLAVPVPDVQVVVVLARGGDGEPFTDRDLSTVYPPIRESAVLLAQAIETRQLARALAPFREDDSGSDR